MYQILEEPVNQDELKVKSEIPQSLEEFMVEMKKSRPDAKTFAEKLKEMVNMNLPSSLSSSLENWLVPYRYWAMRGNINLQ